jgi:hypothetical protein
MDEVSGGWRKLNLYSSLCIIMMVKSGWIRWAGHVAREGRSGRHIGYWRESGRKETTRKTRKM